MSTFFICQTLHGAMFDYKQFPAWVKLEIELHDIVEEGDFVKAPFKVLHEDHICYPPNYDNHGSESYRVYTTAFPPPKPAEGRWKLAILEEDNEKIWVRQII